MLFWQAAVCALRELLQWRNYAGLYEGCQLRLAEGGLVHMKARLRALEAFERLGNWGQVRPGRLCKCIWLSLADCGVLLSLPRHLRTFVLSASCATPAG